MIHEPARDAAPQGAPQNATWIGAASFEDRCVGGLEDLMRKGIELRSGLVLNYGPAPHESQDAQERREANHETIKRTLRCVGESALATASLPAYSYSAMEREAARWLGVGVGDLIIDITCMTKIHTLAIAAVIARERSARRVFLQ